MNDFSSLRSNLVRVLNLIALFGEVICILYGVPNVSLLWSFAESYSVCFKSFLKFTNFLAWSILLKVWVLLKA